MIVVCSNIKLKFYAVGNKSRPIMEMAHKSSSARPPGLVTIQDLRKFNPAPGMVRTFIKMWYKKYQVSAKHLETVLKFGKLTLPHCKVIENLSDSSKNPPEIPKIFEPIFGAI